MAGIFWHNLSIKETEKTLRTHTKKGLDTQEVKIRQKEFGKNVLPEEKPLSSLNIFLEQFRSPLIYVLVIAGIITLIFREYADTIVIFAAVIVNVIVGFAQENKASQALQEIKKVVRHETKVLREGNLKVVDSTELVPGDVIFLNPGDKVSADGRIIECQNLEINEMALTGEWLSATKSATVLPKETPLADRDSMVYMGTLVEDGKAKAIITETGIRTEIGKIAEMVKETREEKTPYQRKIANFSRFVGIIIGVICFVIFLEGMAIGREPIKMFETAVAVAVAAIPEGLPVCITVILALGMQRILKKQGLVRKLVSTETLGSTSIICTDKTATLTEGKMKVSEIIGDKFLSLKAAALTSEAFIENPKESEENWILRGRPTDRALLEAGIKAGINKKKEFEKQKIAELPFNPINKFSVAIYQENGEKKLYICGAPEKILEICIFKKEEEERLEKQLDMLAQRGLRVVASAHKKLKTKNEKIKIEEELNNLTFLGFITLKDPIRKEVKGAIKICRQAGIRPIIVTGDHKLTSRAVAEELGFKIKKENILEGKDLDKMSDADFEKILDRIKIYSRVEPKHKMRIVEAWQERGEVVAMTGDGINDAPALKKADIGVALGSGTEVAKETSDLILLNDSFSIIVAAVEEGRTIVDNIQKVITYLLFDSFSEVFLIGGSMIIALLTNHVWILPITALQILWTNLIEDGLPDIALAFEPKEDDLMQRKPGSHNISLLTKEMKALILIAGLIDDIFLLGLFFWLLNKFGVEKIDYIRTMIFAGLSIDTFYVALACKSLRKNLWHINPLSNRFLNWAIIFGIFMLVLALYAPPLQSLLNTVPLKPNDWLIILGLGMSEMIFIEITKYYFITTKQTS